MRLIYVDFFSYDVCIIINLDRGIAFVGNPGSSRNMFLVWLHYGEYLAVLKSQELEMHLWNC